MEVVIGLLLMLLRVSHGVETYCDGRQDGAQCYGALGETVVLQLMDSASEISRYQLFKNKKLILNVIRKSVTNVIADRSSFTPRDGTFRINDLSRTDGGEYTLTIFDLDGLMSEQRTLQLTFQAPVSSVLLVSKCLSQGEMRVSCSSEGGDSPQYSWTLDGHTLADTQLLSVNNETNNITLKQDVLGQLTCSVKNHVSTVSETKTISTCGFIFIDCISNGTPISQWVLEANNTLCIAPTTTSTMTTEAPVSSVLLVSECLSQGEMRVSCSSEGGDSPQYSWTLDGHTLTDTQLLSGNNEANNITLRQDVSGQLTCSVKNHVSTVSETKTISTCGFIFIDCISNGTRISKWVLEANNTLCIETTTTSTMTTEAPVSSVLLVSECLSQGEMRVSCSSEGGDSPQYSWTLDGHTLTDTQLLSGNNETNNITLKQDVSGQLTCSVKNHVSTVSKTKTISTCGFIFIDCTCNNGMHISQWVFKANNTLKPTTTSITATEAPVSSVLLVSECLSQGEMRVSCSSEGGDSPQYSWTLDGHTLTDTQLLSGNNETNNIILRQGVSGQLTCSVKNHVSSVSKEETISTCDRSLLILSLRAAVAILMLIRIAVYFVWKKKKYEKAEGSSVRRRMEHQENSVIMSDMKSSPCDLCVASHLT
ncbi:hypothetical protein D5F01_LYC15676 [Larimichthys crocea]|uniref:Ig-like domain-containing protein n=1 Tax=Larimichthys crocea TaxID=215358 RepID=A0A6G0I466_LARCR|nr:hypothetical protein D5F01_LYC15676 [Larimichthys crocea]